MNVAVLEKIPEDPEITLAWNNLVLQMERPEVFFTQQWALAASRAFSKKPLPADLPGLRVRPALRGRCHGDQSRIA